MVKVSKSFSIAAAAILVLLIVVGGFVWLRNSPFATRDSAPVPSENLSSKPITSEDVEQAAAAIDSEEALLYAHADNSFQFFYPKGFRVGRVADEASETVLLQDGQNRLGMQLVVSEFQEAGPLTAERIRKDIPDLAMAYEKAVTVGGEQAVAFISQNPSLGETREVWLVHGGRLYQFTTYAPASDFLSKLLGTWKFNE